MKKSELSSIINECVREVLAEDNIANEGFKDAFGKFMGTKWDQTKAEQAYNQTYSKTAAKAAEMLKTDVPTYKAAVIKFMMDNGGLAILGGNGKNAEWQADSKTFKRKAGLAPSSGANVSETEK